MSVPGLFRHPPLRRHPSPGHLMQRAIEADEREAKRQRTSVTMYGGGFYGGAGMGTPPVDDVMEKIQRLSKGGSDPVHLYLNATVYGQPLNTVLTPSTLVYTPANPVTEKLTFTAGSTTVTGTNTHLTQAMVGGVVWSVNPEFWQDPLRRNGPFNIVSVQSATQLTLAVPALWSGDTDFGSGFVIYGPATGGATPTSDVPATFDTTYDKVLLENPCHYKMAVVRFSVPISSIPLFYYPVGSCSVGVVAGGVVYPASSNTTVVGQQVVVVQTLDAANDLPAGFPGFPQGGIAVWNINQFIDAVNDAIYQAVAQMWVDQAVNSANGWLGSSPGGPAISFPAAPPTIPVYTAGNTARPQGEFAPHLAFDRPTQLLSVAFEQAHYRTLSHTFVKVWNDTPITTAAPAGTATLFCSFNLYETYLSTFPGYYVQTADRTAATPPGCDVQLLLRPTDQYVHPTEGSPVALNALAGNGVTFTNAANVQTIVWVNQEVWTGVEKGDIVVLSGIVSNAAANGVYVVTTVATDHGWTAWNSTVINGVTFTAGGGGGAATDQPSYVRIPRDMQVQGQVNLVTQEAPTVSDWSSFSSLRLTTSSVPVRPEYVPTAPYNPSGPGSAQPSGFYAMATTQNSSGQYVTAPAATSGLLGGSAAVATTSTATQTVNTQAIMIDFLPDDSGVLMLRDELSYASHEMYRWIDLIGDKPLQRFDVSANWVDNYGNVFPLYVAPNEVFDIKFLLKQKMSVE